jgi:hypothetical protein
MTYLLPIFYIVAGILTALCIFIANNMSKTTCVCIKHSLCILIFGIGALLCSVFYEPPVWHRLLAIITIFLGLIGWLFFDRYMAHRDLDMVREWIFYHAFYTRQFFIDAYKNLKDWLCGK